MDEQQYYVYPYIDLSEKDKKADIGMIIYIGPLDIESDTAKELGIAGPCEFTGDEDECNEYVQRQMLEHNISGPEIQN